MITALFILFVLFIIWTLGKYAFKVKLFERTIRKHMDDSTPSEDEWVICMHRGKEVPMTYLQKVELWDNMTGKQKTDMVKKLDKTVEKGRVTPQKLGRVRHQFKVYEEGE